MMACGDHRPQTLEEHRRIVGETVYGRIRIYDHACKDEANLVDLGVTKRGTPIIMNKQVMEADRIIITGGLSYHTMAGYGGGRKSLVPGVAGYKTIQANHSLTVRLQPGETCAAGVVETNPLAADLMEAARIVGPDFLINTVTNEHNEVIAVVAGDLEAAWAQGCRLVDTTFGVPLANRADLVVASCGGYPKDMQLYQSMKALDHAEKAVRDHGIIILVTECSDGPGHPEWVDAFKLGGVAEIGASLQDRYTIQKYVALFTSQILGRATVIVVSSLPDPVVRGVGMVPARTGSGRDALRYGHLPHHLSARPVAARDGDPGRKRDANSAKSLCEIVLTRLVGSGCVGYTGPRYSPSRRKSPMSSHIRTLVAPALQHTVKYAGCTDCAVSCQSACKTSCTVGNIVCSVSGMTNPTTDPVRTQEIANR